MPSFDVNQGYRNMNRQPATPVWIVPLLLSPAAFAGSPSSAGDDVSTPTSTAQDTVDVQHVMDAFHDAVATHNGSRLAALFLPEGSTWLNVLSDDAYARAKAKSPDVAKIRLGGYMQFAKFVSTSKASLDPR